MYRILPNNSQVSINRRVPFKRWLQVYILINNRWFQINAGSNSFIFFKSRKKTWPLTRYVFLLRPFTIYCACFLSVSITLMIAMALVQQKNKKYDLKFKLSVVKYAEEKSGEAAARCFSVDSKKVRYWWKNQNWASVSLHCPKRTATGLGCLVRKEEG